ncbi:hypothetical protein [Metabacillus sp. Hm71]|uniref:hypothetical protein n=1 Tax=Metabacillus sp. Hm71 TaxID=3450743 RepID=UPI003F431E18
MALFYSTGPVDNSSTLLDNESSTVTVWILNNNNLTSETGQIKIFELGTGGKVQINARAFAVLPNSSDFKVFSVSNTVGYEVQIRVDDGTDTLVAVWGKNILSNIIPQHRFDHQEMAPISALS